MVSSSVKTNDREVRNIVNLLEFPLAKIFQILVSVRKESDLTPHLKPSDPIASAGPSVMLPGCLLSHGSLDILLFPKEDAGSKEKLMPSDSAWVFTSSRREYAHVSNYLLVLHQPT